MTIFDVAKIYFKLHYFDDTLHPGTDLQHVMTLTADTDATPVFGDNPNLKTQSGGVVDAEAAIADFVNNSGFLAVFNDHTVIHSWNLYYKADHASDPLFITFGSFTGVVGTADHTTVPTQAYSMMTATWLTRGGHHKKLQFMEGCYAVNFREKAPYSVLTALNDINDWLQTADAWLVGRDGTPAVMPISASVKTSDALLKTFRV